MDIETVNIPVPPTSHVQRDPVSSNWKTVGIILLLFMLALVPRSWTLGTFVTRDEPYAWFKRSEGFLEALQQGNFAGTNITGHPGVTTMWLGSAGFLVHQFLRKQAWIAPDDFPALVASMRFPVAVTTSLCVVGAYFLLRRLFGQRIAFLSTLLWATEPFLVAHGRILHLDGLLASFINLSLLAALVAFCLDSCYERPEKPIRWVFLVVSAIMGGLALLTKSPAVLLFPMLGIIALGGFWRYKRVCTKGTPRSLLHRVWSVARAPWLLALLVWVAIALGVWFTLWPALWVDFPGALRDVVDEVRDNGGKPHGTGNFFLGQATDDPGWLFYPIALVLRLTPWTTLGLVLAVLFGLRHILLDRVKNRGMPDGRWWPVGVLVYFAVLFTIMLSIPPKKFDRYALAIVPPLTIIAAIGLLWGIVWLGQHIPARTRAGSGNVNTTSLWIGSVLVCAVNLAWYHPYELAYYNQLLGGGAIAQHIVPVGWGEGLERVATYISGEVGGCDQRVASSFWPLMELYTCLRVAPLYKVVQSDTIDYAVLYIDEKQRNSEPDAIAMLNAQTPIYIERIHGIEYAYVYQIPLPVTHVLQADFGPAMRLRGYDLALSSDSSEDALLLTLQWHGRTSIDRDYMLFVHVLDAQGNRVAQIDVPLGGPNAPTSTWLPGRYVTWVHTIPIPDVPTGLYRIAIGVYDPQTSERLLVPGSTQPGAPDHESNVLVLPALVLP